MTTKYYVLRAKEWAICRMVTAARAVGREDIALYLNLRAWEIERAITRIYSGNPASNEHRNQG